MALIPRERFYKYNWAEYRCNHCFMIKDSKHKALTRRFQCSSPSQIAKCME